tara:strand:- start:327 stop:533 length:207 start_codon:yes stop_codon:yes gene_type:complete
MICARRRGLEFYYPDQGSGPGEDIMKYTTVKISEIAAHPTLRLDPGYWLNKKKLRPRRKRARAQAKKI